MLTIEIKSRQIDTHSGISNKSGKSFTIRKQTAYAAFPEKAYPVEIKISLDDNQEAFDPGNYTITGESYFVNQFGQLALGRLHLASTAAALPKIKAA